MHAVWKYPLEIGKTIGVIMPTDSTACHVGEQEGVVCLWAEVDTGKGVEERFRRFRVVGTGWEYSDQERNAMDYVGTVQIGSFVWHVFEVYEAS